MTPQEWLTQNPNAVLCSAFVKGGNFIFIAKDSDDANEIMSTLAADESFHGGCSSPTLDLSLKEDKT